MTPLYGEVFRRRIAGMGITEVIPSPSSPWHNPYVERLIRIRSASEQLEAAAREYAEAVRLDERYKRPRSLQIDIRWKATAVAALEQLQQLITRFEKQNDGVDPEEWDGTIPTHLCESASVHINVGPAVDRHDEQPNDGDRRWRRSVPR